MGVITVLTSTRWLAILHAVFGEIGALSFLWVLAELINKQKKSYIIKYYIDSKF